MPIRYSPVSTFLIAMLVYAGVGGCFQSEARDVNLTTTAKTSPWFLSGRESDALVASVAFKLATFGVVHCSNRQTATGLVLQHLLQFQLADRPAMMKALRLDRGPAVIVVVPGSPAATAGIQAGDVILQINGAPLPQEEGLNTTFDAVKAHARVDAINGLLMRSSTAPIYVTLLRNNSLVSLKLNPVIACPLNVDLARSTQHNAYADGHHVFLTTGLVAITQNDNQLAFIIAHEMAHNILGHATIMRSGAVHRGLGRTFGESGFLVRDLERRADALAGTLMMDAGYDPIIGISILKRLGGADLGIELFATHDRISQRIAAMRALALARIPL